MNDIKPIIRWAGSKRQLLPQLKALLPQKYERYFEPFFGSGCLFFELRPARSIISDVNPDLISVYKTVRDSPTLVARHLESIPHTAEAYYQLRAISPKALTPIEASARFIFLMKSCFNGVYRTNKSGTFNTPFGGHVYHLPTELELVTLGKLLETCDLRSSDFETVLNDSNAGDFVYADPPYPSQKFRGEYGYDRFSEDHMKRFAEAALAAQSRGVKIMLSFCESGWLQDHFKNWNWHHIKARRTVAAKSMNRKTVQELVITNYKI